MPRKYFFSILIACLMASFVSAQRIPNNYDKDWKKIDSLIDKKGLIQSALEEVNKIYAKAKIEKNDPQLIKSLLYKISLRERTADNSSVNNIHELEKEVAVASQLEKSILLSIEAQSYWNYFQEQRWKLYNRTATINFKKDDISTWAAEDFHKKISELYLASIQPEKLLQQIKLDGFDPIIVKGNTRYLRPTLYDLLAQRALDYFKNDESDANKPAYAFELDNPVVFSDKKVFSGYHFISADSSSIHFKALQLYQQLIQFHLNDAKPDALIDVDIERITFAYQYAVIEDKEELYTSALQHITTGYTDNPTAAQAWYLLAQQYSNKAAAYNPLHDTANRYAYEQAKSICEKVTAQPDSSEGKTNCKTLLKNILRKVLNLQTEKINIPGQPFRMLVSYKNFTQFHYRIIKLDNKLSQSLDNPRQENDYWKKLAQLPFVKTVDQSLPDTKDFQQHSTEIKVDALDPGEYILLASVDKDFDLEKNLLVSQRLYISNIAYINNRNDYFVLNRETGHPLQGTDVQVWYKYYDSKQARELKRKGEEFNTDKNGFFHISPSRTNTNNNFELELTYNNDHLFMTGGSDYYENNSYENDTEDNQTDKDKFESNHLATFLFLDRSIYRPGQIIYFKGIVVTKDFQSRQSKIIPQFKTKVILYNANDERVDSLLMTTNDFGSYHGKFKLPANQLNGEFRIEDDSTAANLSFSVEEYKRPTFHVAYDTIKGSYRINDSIKITGVAKAYAGNAIDGARVKYRVARQARFLYPWLYWRMPSTNQQEITHGEIKTNADGKFFFSFKAIADKSIQKELHPLFDYKIIADITDISGETRSAETIVQVGYQSLNISIDRPAEENLPIDSLKYISVQTKNLSGKFEPTKVDVSIYLLQPPARLIRERYWDQPDQFVMSKEEFLQYFPTDEYADETKKETWKKVVKVFSVSDTAYEGTSFKLQGSRFEKGWYLIEAIAKDKYGEEVKDIHYVQLYDPQTGVPAMPKYNWAINQQQLVEPGNTATVNIGSSANDVFVIQEIDKNRQAVNSASSTGIYSFFNINNERKSFSQHIAESDRGGFGVNYSFVKNNRFYTSSSSIIVPWTNKELSISYETYRDKTLPGSEEKWKIKISGYKKDKIAAEVLAGMYDASLDQFKFQGWNKPDLYPTYIGQNDWESSRNFSSLPSQEKYVYEPNEETYTKLYDQIAFEHYYTRVRSIGFSPSPVKIRGQASMNYAMATRTVPEVKAIAPKIVKDEENKEEEKPQEQNQQSFNPEIQVRKNFNETAFFFPDLQTDSSSNIEFSFTMPEALTQWKWMVLAHTKDLAFGYAEKTIVTQKQLMLQANAPRFLREGDRLEFSTKIVNLSDTELTGQASLQLIDPTTNQLVDSRFSNRMANQYFTVAAKQSTSISFPLEIPYQYNQPVTYKIIAHTNSSNNGQGILSDGETSTLPVLNNRTLVTETLPISINSGETKTFRFEKLLHSGESETLNHHALTVEFSSNPAWYAVQALPYLTEYPYECSEQTFNRFYANALASMIANSSPRLHEIFERWKNTDSAALLSNLQKDEELKSVLLEETPWVLEAKTEAEQKKNIALLFDMARMNGGLLSALAKLKQLQLENGGFAWFQGGPDDRYITQYIVSGIGHLKKLKAWPSSVSEKLNTITQSAIAYLDKKIKQDYDEVKEKIAKNPKLPNNLDHIQVQYLYARSFFSEYAIPGESFSAVNYYRKQSQQFWLQQDKYTQGMIALSLFRTGDIKTAKDILASLKQNSISTDERGIYWKEISYGFYWYQAPIETQSLLIEAFQEINQDNKSVNEMKKWLLQQKQTQNWRTTKATADACYALLLQGSDWINEDQPVEIKLGNTIIKSTNETKEAGTGYFKKTIDGESIQPSMGNITVSSLSLKNTNRPGAWGSIYWQYFENLDKITPPVNNKALLTISKKLFIERNTDKGPVLDPVANNASIKIGDKIKVRIVLNADRDMEYVHMKDMRASCTEPVNVLSGYNWQGGLGYYETTKDASTNFFFNWLPKGTHVFEYTLFVTAAGNFSNGITTIQCMYAPEFSAHSEGVRISVE